MSLNPDYERGNVKLYRADCLDVLSKMPDGFVDSVITDPPYGDSATHASHLSKIILRSGEPAGQALHFGGISEQQCVHLATEWIRVALRWVVFTCEWKYAHALEEAGLLVRLGIWHKPDGAPQFTGDRPGTGWEAVAICHRPGRKHWNGGGRHAFWTFPKGKNHSGHPTEKPLGLFKQFLNDFTDISSTVMDPFMGSCITGIACVQLGRPFIGVEIDPNYFSIACKRIDKAFDDFALFEHTPKAVQKKLF